MKILADTCVWSLLLRRKTSINLDTEELRLVAALQDAVQAGQIVLIGPIRQELLSGLKEPTQFERLRVALAAFPDEELQASDYEEAAQLFNRCRSRGITCGPIDLLICAIAMKRHWGILTRDQDLLRCLAAVNAEKLLR